MNFAEIDFNQLYKIQKQKSTFRAKTSQEWDKKAPSMNERVHNSIYNEEFLKSLNLEGINTLLDVGCGVGNLSLTLAPKLQEVYCLDYSFKMLELLKQNMLLRNIKNIELINKSWYDSWDNIPKVDMVIASRSMEVKDMKEALKKLNEKALKRVYLSYKVGGSFISSEILEVLQRNIVKKPDYIYLINILYQMGINAKVNFIRSESKQNTYNNFEEFVKSVSWSIGELKPSEIINLEEYYKKIKDKSDYVNWAVISWEK